MKRLILIWVGIVALVLVGGAVISMISEKKEETNKKPDIEIVVGQDESGKDIKNSVPDEPITVDYSGLKYTYNPYYWNNQPIVINGSSLNMPLNKQYFIDAGATTVDGAMFTFDEDNVVYASCRYVDGEVTSFEAYHPAYAEALGGFYQKTCKDLKLSCNITLGSSTYEDVVKTYGETFSKITQNGEDGFITSTYYATSDKSKNKMELVFDVNSRILCAIRFYFPT